MVEAQLQEASCLHAHLDGRFQPPGCLLRKQRVRLQSWRLLECTEENFLVQVLDKAIRGEVLSDLVPAITEEFIKEDKIGGTWGCTEYALFDWVILRKMAKNKVKTLISRKTNLRLFRELLDEIPWEAVLRGRRVE